MSIYGTDFTDEVTAQRIYGIGGIFKRLARLEVGTKALQAATDVCLDVLERDNVLKSMKSWGVDTFKDLAEQAVRNDHIPSNRPWTQQKTWSAK